MQKYRCGLQTSIKWLSVEFSTVLLTVAAQEDNGSGLLIICMQSPSKNEHTQVAAYVFKLVVYSVNCRTTTQLWIIKTKQKNNAWIIRNKSDLVISFLIAG